MVRFLHTVKLEVEKHILCLEIYMIKNFKVLYPDLLIKFLKKLTHVKWK